MWLVRYLNVLNYCVLKISPKVAYLAQKPSLISSEATL